MDSCVLKEIELTCGYVCELGDLLHLQSYQPSPRLSLAVSWPARHRSRLPVWAAATVGDTEPFEMYASEDRDAVLEIQVITVAGNTRSGDSGRAIGYFVLPLFHTRVHSITLTSPLLCL